MRANRLKADPPQIVNGNLMWYKLMSLALEVLIPPPPTSS